MPDHNTLARFRTGRLKAVIEDLFYQYTRKLDEMGETDHESVFIDGTKMESCANRYTFVWRGSVEKNLARLREQVRAAFRARGIEGNVTMGKLRTLVEDVSQKYACIEFVYGKGKTENPGAAGTGEAQGLACTMGRL